MYQVLKKLAFKVLPSGFIRNYEAQLRSALGLFYKGNKHHCAVCNSKLSGFVEAPTGRLCPACGSLGRTRFLFDLTQNMFNNEQHRTLHFSPHKLLSKKLRSFYKEYQSTDFEKANCDLQLDIQNIALGNESKDLVICFHVLEHIPDDQRAMAELFRILSKGGSAIIQVPFKEGEIYEDSSIDSPEQRLIHFGQEDHLRYYSLEGLISRLESAGFNCEVIHANAYFTETELDWNGIGKDQRVILAKK